MKDLVLIYPDLGTHMQLSAPRAKYFAQKMFILFGFGVTVATCCSLQRGGANKEHVLEVIFEFLSAQSPSVTVMFGDLLVFSKRKCGSARHVFGRKFPVRHVQLGSHRARCKLVSSGRTRGPRASQPAKSKDFGDFFPSYLDQHI